MAVTAAVRTLLDQLAVADAPSIETLPLDVAREGAIAMVEAFEGEGFDVPVSLHRFDGLIHGFLGMEAIVPEADAAMTEIGAFVRAVCGG